MRNSNISEQDLATDRLLLNHEISTGGEVNGLSFISTLTLALKEDFDGFVSTRRVAEPNESEELSEIKPLDDFDEKKANLYFKPDTNSIFRALEASGNIVTEAGYDGRTLCPLLGHMKNAELHLSSIQSQAIAFFAKQESETMAMLIQTQREQIEEYLAAKSGWNHNFAESEVLGFELAETILKSIAYNHEYRLEFTPLLIRVNRGYFRCEDLSLRIDLKTEIPDLSWEELELRAAQSETIQKNEEALSHLETRHQRALDKRSFRALSQEISQTDKKRMNKEIHRRILDIKRLIHTDGIKHHQNYGKLAEQDKKFFEDLLRELPSGKADEVGASGMFKGYDLHSTEGLDSVLRRVQSILEHAGIKDLKTDAIIQGKNLKEKLNFLNLETLRLRKTNQTMRAQMNAHLAHRAKLIHALQNPTEEKEKLESASRTYRENADALEKELRALFFAAENNETGEVIHASE